MEEKKLKEVMNKNLKSPQVTKVMINYLSLNYNHLKKLDEKDFWTANLFNNK